MKKVAKSGNKQKQKETSAEVERLEKEMAARHERELAQMKAQVREHRDACEFCSHDDDAQ